MGDLKVCVYIRVSTDDQNTDMQLRAINAYCGFHNLQCDIFEEKMSGTNMDRPEFQKMLDLIIAGKYKKLVVWKLDRFSRSVNDLVHLLAKINKAGCAFISLHESIDMDTAVGRMMFHMMAAFAQFTSDTIRENVTAGLAAAKARGVRLGKSPRKIDMDGIRIRKKNGVSVQELAKEVGLSKSQLYKRLQA